eukprot:4338439-Prymnesium_polylepis.1
MSQQHAPPPPPPPPPTGARITVRGLAGRPEFNGQSGTVLSWDGDKGRAGVKLDSGEKLSLKPANIDLVDGGVPPAPDAGQKQSKEKNMFGECPALPNLTG